MTHFTLTNDPIGGPLITAVITVSQARAAALTAAGQPVQQPQVIRALIDTGASGTCVDPSVLAALGLVPTGTTTIHTPSSGPAGKNVSQYDVGLYIGGAQGQPPLFKSTIPVIESDLKIQGISALIGRDVLADCVLVYNGQQKLFTLAF